MSDDEEGTTGPLLDEATGMPHVPEDEVEHAFCNGMKMVTGFLIMPRLIGLGIVLAIVLIPAWKPYNLVIAAMIGFNSNIGYIFLAIGFFSVLVSFMNLFPMAYKGAIMPGNAGNLRSNMHIYKVNFQERNGKKEQLPYVVMEEEGEIGEYNRANRALFHFSEHAIAIGLNLVVSGLIYSLPVFIVTILYCLTRIWYQAAYANGGYGIGCCKHAMPFMFHNVIFAPIFEMFVWVTGVAMLAYPTVTAWTTGTAA